jgi:hypothetical protein
MTDCGKVWAHRASVALLSGITLLTLSMQLARGGLLVQRFASTPTPSQQSTASSADLLAFPGPGGAAQDLPWRIGPYVHAEDSSSARRTETSLTRAVPQRGVATAGGLRERFLQQAGLLGSVLFFPPPGVKPPVEQPPSGNAGPTSPPVTPATPPEETPPPSLPVNPPVPPEGPPPVPPLPPVPSTPLPPIVNEPPLPPVAAPEPASLVSGLLGVGLLGVYTRYFRRRRSPRGQAEA